MGRHNTPNKIHPTRKELSQMEFKHISTPMMVRSNNILKWRLLPVSDNPPKHRITRASFASTAEEFLPKHFVITMRRQPVFEVVEIDPLKPHIKYNGESNLWECSIYDQEQRSPKVIYIGETMRQCVNQIKVL